MEYDVKIQIKFKRTYNKGGVNIDFNDAVYLTPDEYQNLTVEDVNSRINERFENWKNIVDNPPPEYQPTKEDLESEKVRLAESIAEIDKKIVDFDKKLVVDVVEEIV